MATPDRPTVVNLASHAYFNLSGDDDIRDHRLKLFASAFTPVDETMIPLGGISPVTGTPFDFRDHKRIGTGLDTDNAQLILARGYDHNFIVDGAPGELRAVAEISDPVSGMALRIASTQPGVQFYTGNHLTGAFAAHAGLCLETQHFPDSPNQLLFPSTRVTPDRPYHQTVEYRAVCQAEI